MQRDTTATKENNQESIEQDDTSRPGEIHHEEVTVDSDPRDVQLELVRLNPPKRPGMKIAFGMGRMAKGRDGGAFQISSETRARIATLRGLAAMIHKEMEAMPPGPKYDAPATYTGVPRVDGSSKASNFWFAQKWALDLDGTIRNEEEYDLLCRGLEPFEAFIEPTASHDPANGVWRLRVIGTLALSIDDWETYAAVLEWWMAKVCKLLGINSKEEAARRGVDICVKRPFQPMLVPRFPTEERKQRALKHWRVFSGEPVRPDMERIHKEIEAEQKKLNGVGVRASTITVQDDGSIDRLGCALSDLSRAGLTELRPGEGRSDKGLWRAAVIFRDWQVDQRKSLAEMARIFGGLGHEADRIEHKIEDAYSKTDDPRYGCRLRAALAERPIDLAAAVAPGAPQPPLAEGPAKDLGPFKRGKTIYSSDGMRDLRELGTNVLYRKAAQGVGKTQSLKKEIDKQAIRLEGDYTRAQAAGHRRIVIVVHRQALAKNLARRLGLPFYRDPQMSGRIEGSCVICLDSITRVALDTGDEDFWESLPVDLLIVDESEQVVRHLFGDTVKRKFAAIWSHLREMFRVAKHIILQDADLGQVTIEAARILLGWEEASACDEHLEWNQFSPGRACEWQEDEATATKAFLDAVAEGHHVAVYGDSKATIDALYEAAGAVGASVAEAKLTRSGKRIRITRDTSGAGEGADALESPNTIHEKYHVLLYTASANTGVSIDVEGVWRVFGFIRGGCGPTAEDVLQGLCRVRHPVGIPYVWVGNGSDNSIWWSANPERNLADLLTLNERTMKVASSVGSWDKRYIPEGAEAVLMPADLSALRLKAIVMAAEARSKHMRSALREHMETSGWEIDDVAHASDEDKAEAKALLVEARELTENEFIQSRITAAPKTLEQAKADVEAQGTPEDHAALDAALIKDFHGIPRKEPLTEDLVREDDHGRHRAQLRLLTDVHLFQEARDPTLEQMEQMTAKQAAWAGAVRSALADPTGVTWDTRAQEAELIAVILAMMGCQDILRTAQEGKALVFPTLRVGPKTRDLIRRVLHATLPSDEALRRGPDDRLEEGEVGPDGSSKLLNESSGPISHKQWAYILRSIRAKTGLPIRTERLRAGPDRGKRLHYIDLEALQRLLGQAKRYKERRLQGHDWRDPLIDQVCECRVTIEDLFEEWERVEALESVEQMSTVEADSPPPQDDAGILEVLLTV